MLYSSRVGGSRSFARVLHSTCPLPQPTKPPLHTYSTLPIPHAESSGDAARRALLIQRSALPAVTSVSSKGKQPCRTLHTGSVQLRAASAALARNLEADYEEHQLAGQRVLEDQEGNSHDPPPRDEGPPDHSGSESPGGIRRTRRTYRSLLKSTPLEAFKALPALSQEMLEGLSNEEYDRLFLKLHKMQRRTSAFHKALTPEEADSTLYWMTTSPEGPPRPLVEQIEGGRAIIRTPRGFRFNDLLRLCIWFKRINLIKPVFNHLCIPLLDNGLVPVQTVEEVSNRLKEYSEWKLMIDLFAHRQFPAETINLPIRHWTPHILSKIMSAYLYTANPSAIPPLFELYRQAGRPVPTKGIVYHRLMRAYLELGRVDRANQAQEEAHRRGFVGMDDQFAENLNRLQGQRALGFDPELEEIMLRYINEDSVVKDEPGFQEHRTEVLHGLIRLRLDKDDYRGAQNLLLQFGIEPNAHSDRFPKLDKLRPNDKTMLFAFEVFSKRGDADLAIKWWHRVVQSRPKLYDNDIALLVRTLSAFNKVGLAFKLVEGSLNGTFDSSEVEEIIPESRRKLDIKIDIRSMNALVVPMSKKHGIEGLQRVMNLMTKHRIELDETFANNILRIKQQSRTDLPSSDHPVDLAETLSLLLDQQPQIQPTIKHLDTLISEAIKASTQTTGGLSLEAKSPLDLDHPTAGIQPSGRFQESSTNIFDILEKQQIPALSTSLANRMQFDATLDYLIDGQPAIRTLWTNFRSRGFQPNKKHFLALIKGFIASGRIKDAEAVLGLTVRTGNKVTRGMLMEMMNAYDKLGEVRKARKAYEGIRGLHKDDHTQGLDQVAISTMVGIYLRHGYRYKPRKLVLNDLLPRYGENLEDPVLNVALQSFMWFSDEASAVELLDKCKPSGRLNYIFRDLLSKMKLHLERKVQQNRGTEKDNEALVRAREMLDKDAEIRPVVSKSIEARKVRRSRPRKERPTAEETGPPSLEPNESNKLDSAKQQAARDALDTLRNEDDPLRLQKGGEGEAPWTTELRSRTLKAWESRQRLKAQNQPRGVIEIPRRWDLEQKLDARDAPKGEEE